MSGDEQKRTSNKRNNNDNWNSNVNSRDIDVDPLSDYIAYILSQTKAPLKLRIFIFFYGIYWRVRKIVLRKE
ncbi:hypothetical protein [Sulfurisphaera tokodaii]|uniref:hypothetical protein n=1 Tax=Sulfurisphaera tokodaii TaxID=111955 RepID=UPI0018E1B001|nr:hypothetical protein [Sulfurisphaera tokodaii]